MADDPRPDDGADLSVLIGLAREYVERNRFADALALCQGVLARDHEHEAARHVLANALIGAGRPAEARVVLAELAHEHPDRLDYRLDLGRAILCCGEHDDAIRELEAVVRRCSKRAAEHDPPLDQAWLELATAYLAKTAASGDIPAYRLCSSAYKQAYALSSRKRDLMVTMAERFVAKGYYYEAEEALGYALLHAAGDRQIMAFMKQIAQWKEHARRSGSIW